MDFTVEGDGIAFAEKVASYFHTECRTFTRFGTAIIHIPGQRKIDFVTARAESYPYSGSLPEVEFADISSDLTRRDFTINAMALALKEEEFGTIYALEQSFPDLETGIIRVIHSRSFKDDPTRILRAIRFEKRFQYAIEPATLDLMKESIHDDDLHRISVERIRNEFELAFKESNPELFYLRAEQLGIMESIFPSLTIPHDLGIKFTHYTKQYQELAFSRQYLSLYQVLFVPLFSGIDFPQNLTCSKFLKLKWLSSVFRELHHFKLHMRSKIQKTRKLGTAWKSMKGLHKLTVFVILCEEQDQHIIDIIRALQLAEVQIHTMLKGNDLMELGIPKGTVMGRILDRLYIARLDGILKTRNDELNYAANLWKRHLEQLKRRDVQH